MRTNLKRLISTVASALICLGLIIGCNRVPSPLAEANRVIENHPDSALAILKDVDTATLTKERDKALYGLLLTQAKVKTDAIDVDTVLAGSARRYFILHPEKDYRLRANYYSAYKQYLDSCYNPSIVGAANSYLEAEEVNDALWTARSAELIGLILNASYLPKDAIKYCSIAEDSYHKVGRELNRLYVAADLGSNYASSYDYMKADSIFTFILSRKDIVPLDTNLIIYVLNYQIATNFNLGHYDKVDSLIHKLKSYNPQSSPSYIYSYLARIELKKGNLKMAKDYIHTAHSIIRDKYDYEILQKAMISYSKAVKDTKMGKDASDRLASLIKENTENHNLNNINNLLTSSIQKYYNDNNSKRDKMHNILIIIGILLILIFMISLFFFYRRLNKNKLLLRERDKDLQLHLKRLDIINELMNDKDATIDDIQYRLESYKNETGLIINESKDKIKNLSSLVKEEISIVKKLYESFPEFEGPNINIAQRALLLRKQVISNFNIETIELLINCTDIINGGLNSKLKNACPNLSKIYIDIFSLLSLGFSSKSICCLLNQKRSTVDQRKKRLKDAIINSSMEDKDVFLDILNKKRMDTASETNEN